MDWVSTGNFVCGVQEVQGCTLCWNGGGMLVVADICLQAQGVLFPKCAVLTVCHQTVPFLGSQVQVSSVPVYS